jgi:hypothetical protein
MRDSVHDLTLKKLKMRCGPELQTRGFGKAFRRLLFEDVPTRMVPDAFYINMPSDDWPEIVCIEIEDGNALSLFKLKHCAWLWQAADSNGVTFRLFVCDRYGQNFREVDLQGYWFAMHLPTIAGQVRAIA